MVERPRCFQARALFARHPRGCRGGGLLLPRCPPPPTHHHHPECSVLPAQPARGLPAAAEETAARSRRRCALGSAVPPGCHPLTGLRLPAWHLAGGAQLLHPLWRRSPQVRGAPAFARPACQWPAQQRRRPRSTPPAAPSPVSSRLTRPAPPLPLPSPLRTGASAGGLA